MQAQRRMTAAGDGTALKNVEYGAARSFTVWERHRRNPQRIRRLLDGDSYDLQVTTSAGAFKFAT